MLLKPLKEFNAEVTVREPCLIEDDILPYQGKMFLYGSEGIGKSFLMLQLAYEIALGLPWLGQFPTSGGRVVYLQCELPESKLRERSQKMAAALGEVDDVWVHTDMALKVSEDDPGFQAFLEDLMVVKPALWIIDPQYKVLIGDENSAKDLQLFYDLIDKVGQEVGCATILVAHRRKGRSDDQGFKTDWNTQELSGHHRQTAWADAVVRLQVTKRDGKQLVFEKTRYGEAPEKISLGLDEESMLHEAGGANNIEKQIVGMLRDGKVPNRDIRQALLDMGFSNSSYRRAVEHLEVTDRIMLEPVKGDKRQHTLKLKGE